jgi:hypothetical protein
MADETTTVSPERQAILDTLRDDAQVEQHPRPPGLDPGFEGEVGEPLPEKPSPEQTAARGQILDQLHQDAREEQAKGPLPLAATLGLAAVPVIGGPLAIAAQQQPLVRDLLKGFAGTAGRLEVGATAGVSALAHYWDVGRTDMLIGMPVDQVRERRANLIAEQAQIQQEIENRINSGTGGENVNIADLSVKSAQYQRQIEEADGIIASGQAKVFPTGPSVLGAVGGAARTATQALRAATPEALQMALPTTEQMDQSPAGQLLQNVGTMAALAPFAFAGPVADLTVQYLYGAGSQYEDAKASGASDNDAENAALVGGLGALPLAAVQNGIAARLGTKLGGLTTTQALTEVGRAVAFGGLAGGALQGYQDLVARLSGYDPNRVLGSDVIQQAAWGAGLSGLTAAMGAAPGYAKYLQGAKTEVRDRPGAPGRTGPESGEGAQPPPLPVQPPAAPTPLEQAQSAAQATVGAPPEQVIAQKAATLPTALQNARDLLDSLFPETPAPTQPAVATPPVEPAAPPAAEPVVAPAVAPERMMLFWEIAALPGVQRDALDELTRRGMSPQEAFDRISQTRAPDVQGILNEALSVALPPRGLAALRGGEPSPVAEAVVKPTQAEVKQITNDAATKMGLDQVVHYVPDIESLPERVKKTLTDGQRNATAQMVWDNSMRELWVIGDRFDSHQDLQRALIEETQGRIWRDLADINFKHDPNDVRNGYYDISRDRVVLNTDALLRSADPFSNAYKTATEEIAIHKGISRLYGSRESQTYVDAMNSLQRNFDQGKMNDALAQEKGFKNLEDMAKAYGFDDYASNPRHEHALTEELAGAYAQRFQSREDIERNAPRWYQQALETLSNGIRRRLGMDVPPLDMQHLLADSMSALRFPKYKTPGRFEPALVAEAKIAMGEHQLASMRGPEEGGGIGEPTPEQMDFLRQLGMEQAQRQAAITEQVRQQNIERGLGQPQPPKYSDVAGAAEAAAQRAAEGKVETANIGDLFVKDRLRQAAAGLGPEEGLRAQPPKLAMQRWRDLLERMQYADPATAVYSKRSDELADEQARHLFGEYYKGNVHEAMQGMLGVHNPSDINPALRNIVNRATNDQVRAYRQTGLEESARALELERDQFNQRIQERVTGTGQELQAQKRFTDGAQEVGKIRAQLSEQQRQFFANKPKELGAKKVIDQEGRKAAQSMANQLQLQASMAERRALSKAMQDPRTLADRYIRAVADSVDANFAKAGFNQADRPMLQELFNTFQRRIQEQIKEGTDLPKAQEALKASATQSIRDVLGNVDMFKRTWGEVVDTLKTQNPNAVFFANLDKALAEPFGERGVRNVIGESNKIADLIYNHYSTQDRIGNDLARSLTENLGLDPDTALKAQQRFDTLYRQILQSESKAAIERAVKSLGTSPGQRPTTGEVDRILDLMALGGFDKDEYLNVIGPRFGMRSWTPEIVQGMKAAGDMLQQIRDEGNTSPVIRDRYEAQLADLIAQSQPLGTIALRRAESTYMASLLTGLISHAGYALQNAVTKVLNSYIHWTRTGGNWEEFGAMHLAAMKGFERALSTDIPYIWKTGIAPERGLVASAGDELPFRSALESTPFERGPMRFYNNYKYVGRALLALEQFTLRGTDYAMKHVLASRLADEFGYHGAEAERFADQAVYGTESKISDARRQSLEEQQRFGFDETTRKVRENEILDRLKDRSDNPDTSIADAETEALGNIAGQATRLGLHAAYREDVPGGLGVFSRIIQRARAENPVISFIIPFNKLPMNLANEYMAWTPIGVWRGRDFWPEPIARMFGGGDTKAIEKYYGAIPGFAERVARGEISNRELRDMAYEQMVKGAVGTAAMGLIGGYLATQKDNPDPPFWITGEGPPDSRGRDIAKAEGNFPYTIKIGSTRFSYEGLGGLKGMLAAVGGAADYMRYHAHPTDPGLYFGGAVLSSAIGAAGSVTDSSPLQGLASILSIAEGRNTDEKLRRAQDQVAQWASTAGMVPVGGTFGRQTYRVFRPEQYEANDLSSTFIRNIPVLNTMFLRPKLNVLGEPVTNPPWIKIPGAPIIQTSDPVWQYIDHTGLHLTLPGYNKKIDGQALSPEELHIYHETRGKNLKAQLAEAIQDSSFTSEPIEDQNKTVKSEFERNASQAGVQAVIDHRESKGAK